MKDRFTEAFKELEGKNPYVCETCTEEYGHPTIGPFAGADKANERSWGPEDILNPDPRPFGD